MLESIITLLIYIAIVALVVYLVIWVLQTIGVPLPAKVIQILWLIFGLIVLLMLVRLLLPAGHIRLGLLNLIGIA